MILYSSYTLNGSSFNSNTACFCTVQHYKTSLKIATSLRWHGWWWMVCLFLINLLLDHWLLADKPQLHKQCQNVLHNNRECYHTLGYLLHCTPSFVWKTTNYSWTIIVFFLISSFGLTCCTIMKEERIFLLHFNWDILTEKGWVTQTLHL